MCTCNEKKQNDWGYIVLVTWKLRGEFKFAVMIDPAYDGGITIHYTAMNQTLDTKFGHFGNQGFTHSDRSWMMIR